MAFGSPADATGDTTEVASVRDLAERSRPLLPPGSEVRHAFLCQTAPNFGFFLVNWATGLTMHWIKYRCVSITDDAIYVMDSPRLSGGRQTHIRSRGVTRRTDSDLSRDAGGRSPSLVSSLGEKAVPGPITAADAEAGSRTDYVAD